MYRVLYALAVLQFGDSGAMQYEQNGGAQIEQLHLDLWNQTDERIILFLGIWLNR